MGEQKISFRRVDLISSAEVEKYYEYLLKAFEEEFSGTSLREEYIDTRFVSAVFSSKEKTFLLQIVKNAFAKKHPYKKGNGFQYNFVHPIELIDYIVNQGYPLSSTFLRWVYKKFGISWDAGHWIKFAFRSIPPVDLKRIKKEMQSIKKGEVPSTLDFYFLVGTGNGKPSLPPYLGLQEGLRKIVPSSGRFKKFDPIEYISYYYSVASREDLTVTKTHYEIICEKRNVLPREATALIVGNGPIPYEAFVWSMIPEVKTIIPADFDERNNEIMRQFTGGKNNVVTRKIKFYEEYSDFVYYLFERYSGASYGFFSVEETMSVKTLDPVRIDVRQLNPLAVAPNKKQIRSLRADVVFVPFCPESITGNFHQYQKYIKNISNLVDSGKFIYTPLL